MEIGNALARVLDRLFFDQTSNNISFTPTVFGASSME
jgi:hypothetical protein